jgi:hypothetical protein
MKNRVNNKLPLPEAIVSQLNEHTASYMLFFIDADGNPCTVAQTDNAIITLGLHKYIEDYLTAINELSGSEMLGAMCQPPEEDFGEEEEK